MKLRNKKRLITQLLVGQMVLIGIAGITLISTATVVAPTIFRRHMGAAGINSSAARMHISEAFSGAFNLSIGIAAVASLAVAGFFAWYLMRRIAEPIESLAEMAESLALGETPVRSALENSTPEIDRLALALTGMATELAKIQEDQARMLRDLAHELRTPITTIGALVDGIEDGVIEGDYHSWTTIRDQLQRLNRLSRDVRDVSHSYDQPLSNSHVLSSAEYLGRSAIAAWEIRYEKKGVKLESAIADNLPEISVDPIRIGQILSNLLENALRHTHLGGVVKLAVSVSDRKISFAVSDDGEGIPKSQLTKVFNRLYRGDGARRSGDSGSGLGLTIAKGIAESHAGTLVAVSEGEGHGSTFTLTLPVN